MTRCRVVVTPYVMMMLGAVCGGCGGCTVVCCAGAGVALGAAEAAVSASQAALREPWREGGTSESGDRDRMTRIDTKLAACVNSAAEQCDAALAAVNAAIKQAYVWWRCTCGLTTTAVARLWLRGRLSVTCAVQGLDRQREPGVVTIVGDE